MHLRCCISVSLPKASAKAALKGLSSDRSINTPFNSSSYTELSDNSVTFSEEPAIAPIIPKKSNVLSTDAISTPKMVAKVNFKNCFIHSFINSRIDFAVVRILTDLLELRMQNKLFIFDFQNIFIVFR